MATSPNPRSTRALAATAWRGLFDLFMRTRWRRDEVLERLGLTPNDAKALHSLDPATGQRMRALAGIWGTDAPNATWVVDRLERKGLAERRSDPHDRRVKLVVLTARGAEVREEIMRAFHMPPPELLELERADLADLARIFQKLPTTTADPRRTPPAGEPRDAR